MPGAKSKGELDALIAEYRVTYNKQGYDNGQALVMWAKNEDFGPIFFKMDSGDLYVSSHGELPDRYPKVDEWTIVDREVAYQIDHEIDGLVTAVLHWYHHDFIQLRPVPAEA